MFEVNIIPKTEGTIEHAYVDTRCGGKFLGIGQKSPVMQNGQVPGAGRTYDLTYPLLMQEMFGEGRNRRGTERSVMLAVMRAQAKGGEL